MGLCKCPKRKVTNQFCYVHKLNVCEHCMITPDHSQCFVAPYLNWLNDSNFNPNCRLCQLPLISAKPCVRLLCYHVVHQECLNAHGANLPPTTAPAGFQCPTCNKSSVIPSTSAAGPVAVELRRIISGEKWARFALGLPLSAAEPTKPLLVSATPIATTNGSSAGGSTDQSIPTNGYDQQGVNGRTGGDQVTQKQRPSVTAASATGSRSTSLSNSTPNSSDLWTIQSSSATTQQASSTKPAGSSIASYAAGPSTSATPLVRSSTSFDNEPVDRNAPSKKYSTPASSPYYNSSQFSSTSTLNSGPSGGSSYSKSWDSRIPFMDVDEDKYRTKSAVEFLARYFRNSNFDVRRMPRMTYRRWIILGIVLFIGLCTFIHLFLKVGRYRADRDPMLDPWNNPNIRVEE